MLVGSFLWLFFVGWFLPQCHSFMLLDSIMVVHDYRYRCIAIGFKMVTGMDRFKENLKFWCPLRHTDIFVIMWDVGLDWCFIGTTLVGLLLLAMAWNYYAHTTKYYRHTLYIDGPRTSIILLH